MIITKPNNKLEYYPKNQHAKKSRNQNHHQKQQLLEIHKAVAQAWLSHFNHTKAVATSEFDVRKLKFQAKPSRFKLEDIAAKKKKFKDTDQGKNKGAVKGKIWDFKQSLWDQYEIMAVSKRLENQLVLDYNRFHDHCNSRIEGDRSVFKKRKENKNYSFRNLFNVRSPRRFSDVGVYGRDDDGVGDLRVYYCSPFLW